MRLKKILMVVITLTVTVMVLGGCVTPNKLNGSAASSSLPSVVNIGTQQLPNDEEVAIAKGYFEKEMGVKVNIVEFQAGDIRNAMIAKDIDFAMLGSSSATLGIANGMKAEVIWIHEILGNAERLVARKGSNINSIKDLAGKKIATPFSSTAHYSLLKALEFNGISEKEVKLLDMQMPEIYAAWQRGDIDAAYVWEPTLSSLLKNGKTIISSKDLAAKGAITSNVEIVRKDFADKYPNLVVDYIKAVNDAVNLYKQNQSDAVKGIADTLEITPDEALKDTQGSIWLTAKQELSPEYFGTSDKNGSFVNSMMDTANFLYKQNELMSMPKRSIFEQAVNPYFIEEAIK